MSLEQAIHEHVAKLSAQVQGEVLDYVLYLEQKTAQRLAADQHQQRQRLAVAFEHLLAAAPFRDVDAAAWKREQRRLSLGDALIAATYIEHALELATHNTVDFLGLEALVVIDPLAQR